jgi:hypothetical protein
MTLQAAAPNEDLALQLLADGNDVQTLRRFAGFRSLKEARDFTRRIETRDEVRRLVEDRKAHLGAKAISRLGALIDSHTTDGRTLVAASRTLMEAAGHLRRDHSIPVKTYAELTVPELNALITQTKCELERLQAESRTQPVAFIASS